MPGHRNFNELRKQMSPKRRAQIDETVREDLGKMLLSELRRFAGKTQVKLADSMGLKQSTVSQLESQQDMQISTLRRIVEALGGDLEITAILPKGRVELSQFRKHRKSA